MKNLKKVFSLVLVFALISALFPAAVSAAESGNAWIGGTFMHEYDFVYWHEHDDQSTAFTIGQPFTAVLDMGSETRQHAGADWGHILVVQTDIMDSGDYDVYINRITLDGRNISFNANNANVGFEDGLRVALTSAWADNPVVSGYADIGTFSRLEVNLAIVSAGAPSPFAVTAVTEIIEAVEITAVTDDIEDIGEEIEEPEIPEESEEPNALAEGYIEANAWIGGTFMHEYEFVEWYEHDEQSVTFTVGQPFTAVLDMGAGTRRHTSADWGYTLVVQTDIMDSAENYSAYIHSISVDGRGVAFNPDAVEVGFDRGVRVALTSMWAEERVVDSYEDIGTFSRLEVVMAIVEAGQTADFSAEPPPPEISEAPPELRETRIELNNDDTAVSEDIADDDAFPVWAIALIVVIALAGAGGVVFFVMKGKKK
jgi:hypothetical protein